jgi:cytoskeleton protein RodZ
VTDASLQQVDAFTTPGTLLQAARKARGYSVDDVADLLNWSPAFVRIVEGDDFSALPRPGFARGYVRAYGKLVGVQESELLAAFDMVAANQDRAQKRVRTESLQLQRTGAGVILGLLVLLVLVAALWWLRGDSAEPTVVNEGANRAASAQTALMSGETQ